MANAEDESRIKRELVCAASLPTTNSIISGLLVQHALKHLLGFGAKSTVLSYNALKVQAFLVVV